MSSGESRQGEPLPPEAYASLVEEVHVGICVVQDGSVVYVNRWMREFIGSAASDDHPVDVNAVIHPDDRALAARQIQLRLGGGDASPSFPARVVRGDGGVHEVEISTGSMRHRGRPAVQMTLIDITARVDTERNLQEYAARLEESNRYRLLFGDILSHDLMNPVWIAENYLRLVMDGGVPEDRRAFYEGMRGSLAKARGILTDARTWLRIQDRVAFTGERVEIPQLVQEVAKSLRPLWEEKGQEVTFALAPEAAITAGPLLREVVWHLLSNAIKHAPPNSPIDVVASAPPPGVRLEVRDRGPGVPAEDRERIFQRFQSMEKGPITGIGLGLAIVRRVAQLHGGKVWVEGNPGGGSVFVAEFPAAG